MSDAEIRDFIDEGVAEGEQLEYKGATLNSGRPDFPPDVLKTVVAFANTRGGILVYGVPDDSTSRPVTDYRGVRLGAGKRLAVLGNAFRNTCSTQIEPEVYPETRVVELEADEGARARCLLLARINAGLLPPYLLRGHGIYLRVGESDRHASVTEIDALFKRRQTSSIPTRLTGWQRVLDEVFAYGNFQREAGSAPHLIVGLTPLFPVAPAAMNDQTDGVFRTICSEVLGRSDLMRREPHGISHSEFFAPPDVRTSKDDESPFACSFDDGAAGIRRAVGASNVGGQEPFAHLSLARLWAQAAQMLLWARHWTRSVVRYDGAVEFQLMLTDLVDAVLPKKSMLPDYPMVRNAKPTWDYSGQWGERADLPQLLSAAFKTLSRQLQYTGFDQYASELSEEADRFLQSTRLPPE